MVSYNCLAKKEQNYIEDFINKYHFAIDLFQINIFYFYINLL